MEDKILNYINDNNMIDENDLIVIGVSGGADSMCLLVLLNKIRHIKKFDIIAVHINHGIRGEEARRDEEFVKKYCTENNINLRCFELDIIRMARENGQSTEEAGRCARYDTFRQVGMESAGKRRVRIAVAHHENDLAETVLFNLVRGTGLRGAMGIVPVNNDIIRPLLCVNRKQIEEYLDRQGVEYVTDSTNLSNDYTRNKFRNVIIPYLQSDINEGAVDNICSFTELLAETVSYMEHKAEEAYENNVIIKDNVFIIKNSIVEEDKSIGHIVIRKVIENLNFSLKDITHTHIMSIFRLFFSDGNKNIALPYNIQAYKGYKGIYVYKGIKDIFSYEDIINYEFEGLTTIDDCTINVDIIDDIAEITNIKFALDNCTKYFDYDKIIASHKQENVKFEIRTRQSGDYIKVTMEGRKKLIKELLIDKKVPRQLRDKIPLICIDNEVIWCVGIRDSAGYRIDSTTRKAIKISLINKIT